VKPISIITFIVLFIWQLPQNILGLALIALYKIARIEFHKQNGVYVLSKFWAGGVSLGHFIFLYSLDVSETAIQHERGHQRQSLILGPLYLIVVGIPSAILCTATNFSPKISRNYYNYFPENWADKLGGVKRP